MFDPTLNGVMAQIEAGKIVLPAMQRPFVWKDDRITKLIDSMLRGFPLGTALLWKTATMQRFRRFQKDVQPDAGITVDFDSDDSTERYLVLDGQQRLTSLFVAITGTYDGKKLFLDVLSGVKGEKDPGDAYWDCRFLTEKEAKELNAWPRPAGEKNAAAERAVFVKFHDLTKLAAARAGVIATQKAAELGLDPAQTTRMTTSYLQAATVLASKTALQIHLIDEDSGEPMPIEEILEVFVRVNSGGLVLQKSDLLMSLLDLKWNDIQPELYRAAKEINAAGGLVMVPVLLHTGWPRAEAWPWLVASVIVHLGYYFALTGAYARADMSQVYPVARGSAPLMTALLSVSGIAPPV